MTIISVISLELWHLEDYEGLISYNKHVNNETQVFVKWLNIWMPKLDAGLNHDAYSLILEYIESSTIVGAVKSNDNLECQSCFLIQFIPHFLKKVISGKMPRLD